MRFLAILQANAYKVYEKRVIISLYTVVIVTNVFPHMLSKTDYRGKAI